MRWKKNYIFFGRTESNLVELTQTDRTGGAFWFEVNSNWVELAQERSRINGVGGKGSRDSVRQGIRGDGLTRILTNLHELGTEGKGGAPGGTRGLKWE